MHVIGHNYIEANGDAMFIVCATTKDLKRFMDFRRRENRFPLVRVERDEKNG